MSESKNSLPKITSAAEAIRLLTDEAERQGADANDSCGIVREMVMVNLPGRPDAQFSAWLSVCIDLANRAAVKQGYQNEVERAYTLATRKLAEVR